MGIREGRDERDRRLGHPSLLRFALPHGAGRPAGPDKVKNPESFFPHLALITYFHNYGKRNQIDFLCLLPQSSNGGNSNGETAWLNPNEVD